MENDIYLSIIIPCYDVPLPLLETCVQRLSFLQKLLTYEVWIIDDGSKKDDVSTWAMEQNDPHLHVVRQHNTGPGGARNTGIDNSRGKYITFVDADDFLQEKPYLQILHTLIQHEPDILCHGTKKYYEGSATAYMATHDIRPTCWSYIIRRSVLGNLRFTPYICHEDEEFCTMINLLKANMICMPVSGYHYRYRPYSLIHNPRKDAVEKRHNDFMTVLLRFKSIHGTEEMERALERRRNIMVLCYIIILMKETINLNDLTRLLCNLQKEELYPLPKRDYGTRYRILQKLLATKASIICLSPFVKLYYRFVAR